MDHPALNKYVIFIQKSIDILFAQNGMTINQQITENNMKLDQGSVRFCRKGIMIRVGYHHCLEQTWETH